MIGRSRSGGLGVFTVSDAVTPPPSDHEIRMSQFFLEVACSTPTPEPEVIPDPDGGGEGPPGVNPDAGVSVCGSIHPVAWWEIEYGDDVYKFSNEAINIGADPKKPEGINLGTITRSLSNQFGDFRGTSVDTTFNDTKRVLRDLEASDSLIGCRASAYISTTAAMRQRVIAPTSLNKPRRVLDGRIVECQPAGGFLFDVQVKDFLSILFDQFKKATYPQRVFNLDDFPNMGNPESDALSPGNPSMLGKSVPVGYGRLSDEGSDNPIGVVTGIYTGQRAIDYYDGALWREHVFLGHAPGAFQSLFIPEGPGLSTGTTYASRIRITGGSGVVEYLIPGTTQWETVFGPGAPLTRTFNGREYCVVYSFGPRSDLNITDQVPLGANLWGAADADGNVITGLYRQIVHAMVNWIFQTFEAGDWLDVPSVGAGADLYSRIDVDSFYALEPIIADLVGQEVEGAWLMGHQGEGWDLTKFFTQSALNGHFRFGVNKDGQLAAFAKNPAQSINRKINNIAHIHKNTFNTKRYRDEVVTVVDYRCARRYLEPLVQGITDATELLPASNKEIVTDWEFDNLQVRSTPDIIEKYGERGPDIDFEMLRVEAVATAIATAIRDENELAPIRTVFEEGPCGTDTDLGMVDRITHPEALTEAPRKGQCDVHELNLNTFEVKKEYLDYGLV